MTRTITVAPVKKTVRVEASQAHAFEVFTSRIGAWWPHSHSINGGIPQKDVVIEPRRGGRWYERGEDGSECYWGDVVEWDPPARVVLSWHLNGKFQFDSKVESEVDVRFVAEGPNATRVELEHRITAAEDAETLRSGVDAPNGWTAILGLYRQTAAKT